VTVTATDANGCTDTETTSIEVLTAPTASIVETDASCAVNDGKVLINETATLTASGGDTYSWSYGSSTGSAIAYSNGTAGSYTVTVTATGGGVGCTATATTSIEVLTAPTASITETDASCVANDSKVLTNETATLTASGGDTYLWSHGASTGAAIAYSNAAAGTYTVTVTATDANGCTDTETTSVTVADYCYRITGNIGWEQNNAAVQQTTVTLSGAYSAVTTTDASGNYSIDVKANGQVIITPTKTINLLNGVTSADVTLIQRHAAGTYSMPAPYKRIASDVNNSNTITTADALYVSQRIALGNPTQWPSTRSWKFVPSDYVFSIPLQPWGYPVTITLAGTTLDDQTGKNFKGVKLGDVNGSGNPANAPLEPLVWKVDDRILQEGDDIAVDFKAEHFTDLSSFQYALQFDPTVLKFKNVVPAVTTLNMGQNEFGMSNASNGEIRSVWAKTHGYTLDNGTQVFTLHFQVLQGGVNLSEILQINTDGIPAVAYDNELVSGDVQLVYNASPATGTVDPAMEGKLQLLQNRPNPFVDETVIPFVLPQACNAQIRIYDLTGRLLEERTRNYSAGYQQEVFKFGQNAGKGMLYYELTTEYGKLNRKMLSLSK
jgi:hypothetical protein